MIIKIFTKIMNNGPFNYCDVRLQLVDAKQNPSFRLLSVQSCAKTSLSLPRPSCRVAATADKEICPSYLTHAGWRGEEGIQQRKLVCFNEISSRPPQAPDKELGDQPSSTKSAEAEWGKIACWSLRKMVCRTFQNQMGKNS